MAKLKALHPGDVLREEFLRTLGLSAGRLAKALRVPRTRIERLAAERVDLSADTALRLAKYFGTTVAFWMALKSCHECERAQDALGKTLERIEREGVVLRSEKKRFGSDFAKVDAHVIAPDEYDEAPDLSDRFDTDGWLVDRKTGALIGPDPQIERELSDAELARLWRKRGR